MLVAAAGRQGVELASADDQRTFEAVASFDELDRDEAWTLLVTQEPRLADLEAETRTGAFSPPRSPINPQWSKVLRETAHEQALESSELGDRVRALLGPLSDTSDPLLRSRTALGAALAHLAGEDPAAPS